MGSISPLLACSDLKQGLGIRIINHDSVPLKNCSKQICTGCCILFHDIFNFFPISSEQFDSKKRIDWIGQVFACVFACFTICTLILSQETSNVKSLINCHWKRNKSDLKLRFHVFKFTLLAFDIVFKVLYEFKLS